MKTNSSKSIAIFWVALLALAVAVALVPRAHSAASPAATQAWVKQYIAALNGGTNGVIVTEGGGYRFEVVFEPADQYAIVVTNSTDATVTNGTLFAYTTDGVYTNGVLELAIYSTSSNLVYSGVGSVVTNGFDYFDGYFGVLGTRITQSQAEALR